MDNFQKYTLKLTICFLIVLFIIGIIGKIKKTITLQERLNEILFELEYTNFCVEDSLKQ